MDNEKDDLEDQGEYFIKLLAENERALTRYVMSLVPSLSDAEDILQESKLAMWRSFKNFEPGTNFNAWSRKVVFYRILTYRKQKSKENERHIYSDTFYELLQEEVIDGEERREQQFSKLKQCIKQLQETHHKILMLRYNEGHSIEQLAEAVGRTVAASYKTLSRIRLNLRNCLHKSGPRS